MSASREKKKRQEQGAEVVSAETKKGMNKTVKKLLTAVVALVLVACIVFLSLVSTGFFNTHTTAAIANGHKLTPAMLNYYYTYAYQQMSSILGYVAEANVPLDEQAYMTDDYATWHDYLVDYAVSTAASTYAIYDEATANGYTLSDETAASVDSELQMIALYASMYGASSTDAYLASVYGKGCDEASYREYATVNYTAQEYASKVYTELSFTQDEIDAYYAENQGDFDAVSFRQFTISAIGDVDEDNNTTYSDEALAAAEESAKAMAEASQGDEQAFLDLALENTAEENQESYNAETATLREDIAQNNCTEVIRAWLTDDARQAGDTTYIFNGTASYYVLYFLENVDHTYLLPNVRHILIGVSDTSDEEAMAEAKEEAETLLNEFLAGDATEDAFAALANEKSEDSGSNTTGGLYENIAPGDMVDSFDAWCFDESRQVGDTGIVESSYGYHIMYFSGYGESYQNHVVEETLVSNAYTEWQTKITDNMTYELVNDKYVTVRSYVPSSSAS